jgi:iron(III) transport system ATP-binding protein
VTDNVRFGLSVRGAAATRAVAELLEMVGLTANYGTRYPHELSGGQQQRVALARALAARPEVVLLDEPFSSLDAGLREGTRRAIMGALANTGTTAVLVTHDQAEALSVADQVGVMFDGRLAQVGTPTDVYAAPVDLRVGTFVGEANVLPADLRGDHAICALGVVPVRGCSAPGRGQVLIRPEQLQIVDGDAPGSSVGRVKRCTFYGPTASVDIEVQPEGVGVTARVPTFEVVPSPGSMVGVVVRGRVAAFPDLSAD